LFVTPGFGTGGKGAHTYQVIDTFPVGARPQHVVPSYDLKTLWVTNDEGNTLTPVDPATGEPGKAVPVPDPYNMYFTPTDVTRWWSPNACSASTSASDSEMSAAAHLGGYERRPIRGLFALVALSSWREPYSWNVGSLKFQRARLRPRDRWRKLGRLI
jgi:hypothetical protein